MLNKLCYVAGGGGIPAAIIHLGIVKKLLDNNYNINTQIGTSAGSIIGAQLAVYKTHNCLPLNNDFIELLKYDYSKYQDLNIKDTLLFYSKKLLLKHDIRLSGKYKGQKMYNHFCQKTKNMTFGEIENFDLYITATELTTGSLIVFSKKTTPKIKLADAIRASSSIQGIFQPQPIEIEKVKNGVFLRNSINKPYVKYKNIATFDSLNEISYKNKYLLCIDGGNNGNCRIDIGTNVKNTNEQIVATSFTQNNKPEKLTFQLSLLTQTINIMMAATEKLIIKYSELKYNDFILLRPDTYNVKATEFDIDYTTKEKLFYSGQDAINQYI